MTILIKRNKKQEGFTIVELMVGMVIGLIAVIVIMQTFSAFEGNKRTTTGVSDAQTNGSIGLYMIQRELQFAGYGVPTMSGTMPVIKSTGTPEGRTFANYTSSTDAEIQAAYDAAKVAYDAQLVVDKNTVAQGENYSALKCSNALNWLSDIDNNVGTAKVSVNVIAPATIIEGGAGNDAIAIQYGTTSRGALPTTVTGVTGAKYVGVENNFGCRAGDIVIVMPDMNKDATRTCYVDEVDSATTTNAWLDTVGNTNSLNVKTSNAGMYGAISTKLACLGQMRRVIFDVNSNQLRKGSTQTGAAADMQPVITEVVALQAQYGISATPNSEVVDAVAGWVNAAGAWAAPDTTSATCNAANANRNCIKAIRIALVARNNLLEKTAVSQACNGTAPGLAKVCIWGNQNVTLPGLDWASYRYREYELVVPLRNVLAASPQL